MSVRWIAASTFVALAGTAAGQTTAILGKSDAEFASELLRGGYSDLAEKLCRLLLTKGDLPPEEAAGVKGLNLDLRLDLALRETDVIKRKDLLTTILMEKEDLVRQYAGRKVAENTSATLPEVYQRLGETIARAIQTETDPNAVAQLQKDGVEIFKTAEQKLEARIKDLGETLAESSGPMPKLEEQLITARYNLPRTRYFHALLYGKADTTSRDIYLDEAVNGFQEFQLDYGDTLFGYEALVYEGLCYKEKEVWDDALQAFDDAIGLREGYERDAKAMYPMGIYEADLVSWAVLQKVQLLSERGDTKAALDEAKYFLDTTPSPYETRHGLALLALQADAFLASGDVKAAADAADKLVEYDPRGPWGATGREIQGRLLATGGPIDPEKVLKIAQTYIARGDEEQALRVAHQAIGAIGGDAKQAGVAIDAWLLVGSTFLSRGWVHEAALAFDAAADRFAANEKAAEAMYQAMKAYQRLAREEKKAFYKTRAQERQKTLVTKYPTNPRAIDAGLAEADDLAGEGNYLEAADLYGRVQPGSQSYILAQLKMGECYFLHGRDLMKQEAKKAEGRTFLQQAETLMKKARADADKAYEGTLNLADKKRFESIGLSARNRLAQLYLEPGVDRPAEVIPLLEGADERFSDNQDAIAYFRGYRIDALSAQGKLEEAIAMLDALARKDPDASALGAAAGKLARTLDQRASDLRDKEKKPREAVEMRKKAATYYAMEGRALLKTDNPRVAAIETTANRLFAIGLNVNEVPEEQQTFVGWDPDKNNKETDNWRLAAELLAAALRLQPGYQMQVTEARCYGFLGQYDRATVVLGALFDHEKVYDPTKKQLNIGLLRGKPELTLAYLEWGVAEHFVAVKEQDTDRFRRAQEILSVMVRNLDATSRSWWFAKYYEIQNASQAGTYSDACFLYNDLKRTTTGMGSVYGLEARFAKLGDDLKDKCK